MTSLRSVSDALAELEAHTHTAASYLLCQSFVGGVITLTYSAKHFASAYAVACSLDDARPRHPDSGLHSHEWRGTASGVPVYVHVLAARAFDTERSAA